MLFSRLASIFTFTLTLGGLALASPAAGVEKRANTAAVKQVVMNLKSSTDSILPEIKNMVAHKNVTEASVVPLMNQLIGAFNTAHGSLAKVPRSVTEIEKRQSASDIAALITEIITEITTVLEGLLGSSATIPILGGLISELDAALTSLLTGLEGLVTGLVTLLSGLLATVSGLLASLGLGLLTGLLGL